MLTPEAGWTSAEGAGCQPRAEATLNFNLRVQRELEGQRDALDQLADARDQRVTEGLVERFPEASAPGPSSAFEARFRILLRAAERGAFDYHGEPKRRPLREPRLARARAFALLERVGFPIKFSDHTLQRHLLDRRYWLGAIDQTNDTTAWHLARYATREKRLDWKPLLEHLAGYEDAVIAAEPSVDQATQGWTTWFIIDVDMHTTGFSEDGAREAVSWLEQTLPAAPAGIVSTPRGLHCYYGLTSRKRPGEIRSVVGDLVSNFRNSSCTLDVIAGRHHRLPFGARSFLLDEMLQRRVEDAWNSRWREFIQLYSALQPNRSRLTLGDCRASRTALVGRGPRPRQTPPRRPPRALVTARLATSSGEASKARRLLAVGLEERGTLNDSLLLLARYFVGHEGLSAEEAGHRLWTFASTKHNGLSDDMAQRPEWVKEKCFDIPARWVDRLGEHRLRVTPTTSSAALVDPQVGLRAGVLAAHHWQLVLRIGDLERALWESITARGEPWVGDRWSKKRTGLAPTPKRRSRGARYHFELFVARVFAFALHAGQRAPSGLDVRIPSGHFADWSSDRKGPRFREMLQRVASSDKDLRVSTGGPQPDVERLFAVDQSDDGPSSYHLRIEDGAPAGLSLEEVLLSERGASLETLYGKTSGRRIRVLADDRSSGRQAVPEAQPPQQAANGPLVSSSNREAQLRASDRYYEDYRLSDGAPVSEPPDPLEEDEIPPSLYWRSSSFPRASPRLVKEAQASFSRSAPTDPAELRSTVRLMMKALRARGRSRHQANMAVLRWARQKGPPRGPWDDVLGDELERAIRYTYDTTGMPLLPLKPLPRHEARLLSESAVPYERLQSSYVALCLVYRWVIHFGRGRVGPVELTRRPLAAYLKPKPKSDDVAQVIDDLTHPDLWPDDDPPLAVVDDLRRGVVGLDVRWPFLRVPKSERVRDVKQGYEEVLEMRRSAGRPWT